MKTTATQEHRCEEVWCTTCRNRDKAEYEARCGFLFDVKPVVAAIVGCSQCGRDFASGLKVDGFSHCRDHIGMRGATEREVEAARLEVADAA